MVKKTNSVYNFCLVTPNGDVFNQTTKITVKGQPYSIDTNEKLATFIYNRWKDATKSKSFFDWCEELNNDTNFEGGFTIEMAVDNLASSMTLNLYGQHIDLYKFMVDYCKPLKKLCWKQAFNKDFFEVLYGSQNGTYNHIYIISLANFYGFGVVVPNINDEDLIETLQKAEAYIQTLCYRNIHFGCTEQCDWVVAHKDNECWS